MAAPAERNKNHFSIFLYKKNLVRHFQYKRLTSISINEVLRHYLPVFSC